MDNLEAGVSNLRPAGHMWPRMAMNVAQHKTINLFESIMKHVCDYVCRNVFTVWPKTTTLLPVWPRDAKRLDIPDRGNYKSSKSDRERDKHHMFSLIYMWNPEGGEGRGGEGKGKGKERKGKRKRLKLIHMKNRLVVSKGREVKGVK